MDISSLGKEALADIIKQNTTKTDKALLDAAVSLRRKYYGNKVFLRGLIEISSYCKNNCLYCGIRLGNKAAHRYRLSAEEILACCERGYSLGFRTFVLQGGEDLYYTDALMCSIISRIKEKFPECAVTLSLGEKSRESYLSYKNAGADRYLLRHESANDAHYKKLHPSSLSPINRKKCLHTLKELGFQVGAGFMVGSPYQTAENLAEDLLFLKELEPHMVGIGPFIPHSKTPFAPFKAGTLPLSVTMLALTRILLPKCLLPATTALNTISPHGREEGFSAGANVVMPNLSPPDFRDAYSLYDNKTTTGDEAAESIKIIKQNVKNCGLEIDFSRGDNIDFQKEKTK